MKHVTVGAAVIVRTNNATHKKEVFVAQRGYGEFKGGWEFPGGKLETNETIEQCIVREIREELGILVKPINQIDTVEYDYPAFHLTMHCVLCSLETTDIELYEHKNGIWLSEENLYSIDWLPADKIILEKVANILE